MHRRIFSALMTLGIAAFLALLLGASIRSAAPVAAGTTDASNGSPANSGPASVSFRRAISVPFGIAITQELNSLGSQVMMTGHGNCWADSQMFDLHVRVAQSTTHAFAEGHTIDNCTVDEQQWDAPAQIERRPRFEEGPARACAEATEWGMHGTVDEHAWCKDIMLEQVSTTY